MTINRAIATHLKLNPNGRRRRTNDFPDKAEILIRNVHAYRFHL